MADLYEAIKAEFDAAESLCGSASVDAVFDELHFGEVGNPTDVPVPYCTMTEPQEPKSEGGFARTVFVQETFSFVIVESTEELAASRAALVNAVFDSMSLRLTATGLKSLRLEKMNQAFEQADEDRWGCMIAYQASYFRRRPA